MNERSTRCVLLADSHHRLVEGMRGLLETAFGTVFMVGDEASLIDGVERLKPSVTVVDLALAGGNWVNLLRTLRQGSPASKLIVLSMYDKLSVARAAMGAGGPRICAQTCHCDGHARRHRHGSSWRVVHLALHARIRAGAILRGYGAARNGLNAPSDKQGHMRAR